MDISKDPGITTLARKGRAKSNSLDLGRSTGKMTSAMRKLSFLSAFAVCLLSAANAQSIKTRTIDLPPGMKPPGWEGKHPHSAPPAASTSPVGYVPAQIRHAYTLDEITNTGSGQTIGIVVPYGSPTLQHDLDVFSDKFGIARTTVEIVTASEQPVGVDPGWALETSLDAEWAHALAPGAKLVVAVAPSSSFTDLLTAVDAAVEAGATVVTMSWGGMEFPDEVAFDSHFQKEGVTFLAASGDKGAGASWPAVSPSVVSVGGTTLLLDPEGNLIAPETGWSGSGGGFSAYFSRPAYQNGWQAGLTRAFPDVALVADPKTGLAAYDSTPCDGQSGWFQMGGTSASCPMWGAIVALANEQRVAAGKKPLTGSSTAIYNIAGSKNSVGAALYGYFYFDVTLGNNGGFGSAPKFDQVTGLGTPVGTNLVPRFKTQ